MVFTDDSLKGCLGEVLTTLSRRVHKTRSYQYIEFKVAGHSQQCLSVDSIIKYAPKVMPHTNNLDGRLSDEEVWRALANLPLSRNIAESEGLGWTYDGAEFHGLPVGQWVVITGASFRGHVGVVEQIQDGQLGITFPTFSNKTVLYSAEYLDKRMYAVKTIPEKPAYPTRVFSEEEVAYITAKPPNSFILRATRTSSRENIAESGETAPDGHPMRGVLLLHALQADVWITKQTLVGRTTQCSHYGLSWTVDRVDVFVSHAWQQDGKRKLAMLREFLCLHSFLGQVLIALPMLMLFRICPAAH